MNRKAILEAPRSESEKEMARRGIEASQERERERETREKIRELSERRKLGPAHPQAESIVAAMMADPAILDAMRHKLRKTSQENRVFRALDIEDVGVLCVILHLLEDGGAVRITNISTSATFADPELPRISNLGPSSTARASPLTGRGCGNSRSDGGSSDRLRSRPSPQVS